MELLDHMVNSIFNFLRNCYIVFQWLYHFTFPQCTRVSVHSHSSQHLFWGWLVGWFLKLNWDVVVITDLKNVMQKFGMAPRKIDRMVNGNAKINEIRLFLATME